MDTVFNKMKGLVPEKTLLKERQDGDFLVVCNEDMNIFYLNETSADVYSMCDGKTSLQDIFRRMKDLYDVSETELEADLVVLIRDLQWKQLLRLMEPHR